MGKTVSPFLLCFLLQKQKNKKIKEERVSVIPVDVYNLCVHESKSVDPRLRWRIGAVIFDKNGKILSSGRSHYTLGRLPLPPGVNYRCNFGGKFSVHAETHALYNMGFDQKSTKNNSIFTIGFVFSTKTSAGSFCKSKPCKVCQNLLSFYRIKNVFYIDKNGKIVHEILN